MPNWSNLDELGSPHERAAARTRAPYEGIPQRDFPILDAIANKSSILGPLGEALGPGVPEYGDTQGMIERAVPLAMLGTGGGMLRGRAPGPGTELGAGGGWRRFFGGGGGERPPPRIENPEEAAKGIVRVFKGDIDQAHAFISQRAAKMKGDKDYEEVLEILGAMKKFQGVNVKRMPVSPEARQRLKDAEPVPASEPAPSAPAKKRAPRVLDWNRAREVGRGESSPPKNQSIADIVREFGGDVVANPEELAALLGLGKPKGK